MGSFYCAAGFLPVRLLMVLRIQWQPRRRGDL
jgi:hypothetical protein